MDKQTDRTVQLLKASADSGPRKQSTLHPVALFTGFSGISAIPLGVIAWMWWADWRWIATGFLAMLAILIIAGALNGSLPPTQSERIRPDSITPTNDRGSP